MNPTIKVIKSCTDIEALKQMHKQYLKEQVADVERRVQIDVEIKRLQKERDKLDAKYGFGLCDNNHIQRHIEQRIAEIVLSS